MKRNPAGVRFSELEKVCTHYFGESRAKGTSHHLYRTPWKGEQFVNIQNDHDKAITYQVRQVLQAIEKLEGDSHE